MQIHCLDIRISFVRFNTFGDELFQNEKNMRYYWYGVSDLAVGGRWYIDLLALTYWHNININVVSVMVTPANVKTFGSSKARLSKFAGQELL